MSAPRPAAEAPVIPSQIVEASAGTGKTRALVEQVVAVIAAGTPVDRIAAVTFTHAAAGEMKWRVRQGLEIARLRTADPAERDRLVEALRHLDRAFIGTIHSFCAQLLHQRPVEACVDPAFGELDQPQAFDLFSGVFRRWIERKLEARAPALERALVRLAWDEEWRDPLDTLRREAWKLIEWRDFSAPWTRRDLDRAAELDGLIDRAAAVCAMRERCSRPVQDPLFRWLQPLADFVDRVGRMDAAGARDYDLIEADALRLPRDMKWPRKGYGPFGEGLSRDAMFAAWEDLERVLGEARVRLEADLAAGLRTELWELAPLYQEAKQRRGQLDFMDLLLSAARLLRHDGARLYFQRRYERILIDEFQDTDPLQAEVLLLLSADDPAERDWRHATPQPGKLFVVGDPKQSIYRFRRADVALYRRIAGDLCARGVERRTLQNSRRSIAPLHDFVNAAFAERMPGYLALGGGREAIPRQPAVVALPMPAPYGSKNIAKAAIDRCSPVAVGAFVDWLVRESGWRVSDPQDPARTVPLAEEHVCILFRRFTNWGVDLTTEYVRALEARNIAHVLVGSKSFHQREEVGTIRTALRAIEWPEDRLAVFATLRGPLFAITDGTLLKFRHQVGPPRPFMRLPEELEGEFEPVRDALATLAKLHRGRNGVPVADTINRLLEHTRAHAGFAFRTGGARVLANVYRLTDMARAFEARGATSFRSFIDFLDREADLSEAAEAPLLEQQAGGVKLMTVHRAKGLEFPVVILADLTAKLAAAGGEGGDRWVDPERGICAQKLLGCAPWDLVEHREEEGAADREEAERVAYVAATRARDLLVVAAIGDQEFAGSWLTPLYPALYPPRDRYRVAVPHPGCAVVGEATVLERPPDYSGAESSVRPGLHQPQLGSHEVLWFDPALLDLGERKDQGLAFEEALVGNADAGLRRYEDWRQARAAVLEAGAVPEYRLHRATEFGPAEGEAFAMEVVPLGRVEGGERRSGRVFGKLVHALLADAVPATEAVARSYARLFGATGADVAAALELDRAARAHPLLQQAAHSAAYREMPLLLRLADGTLVEGRVDLAFRDGAGWTVVEFKTDDADRLRYRRQLQLYGVALHRATGLPVRGVLFEL
jgi:ATP-dependent helicase/nuclease subunit A